MADKEKFNRRGHWSKNLQREVELAYTWETVKGYLPRLTFKNFLRMSTAGVGLVSLGACNEANSQRTALATEVASPLPTETYTVAPLPTQTETLVPTETSTITPSPTESCLINGVTFTETNRHPDGGYRYPADMSKIDKPINQWTQAERTTIVDAAGNPIYDGVRAIANSGWVSDNKLNYAGTWIGRGCGYGLMFNNNQGEKVWATNISDMAMGRPDGNGLGIGVQTIPNPGVEGHMELIVGREQTVVWVRGSDQIIGKYNPVTQKWDIMQGFQATKTSIPDVIHHPEALIPVSWGEALNLASEDCDQDIMQELIDQYGMDGYIIYSTRLLNKAFNVEIGSPPGYSVPSSEIEGWLGKKHPSNSCYITWAQHHDEEFLIYLNNNGQTVLIPVTGGP